MPICENCGAKVDKLVRHHVSYEPERVEYWCILCHRRYHATLRERESLGGTNVTSWRDFISIKRIKGREYVYVHWGEEGKRRTRYCGPANQSESYQKAQQIIKEIILNRIRPLIYVLKELGVEVKIEERQSLERIRRDAFGRT